MILIVQITTDVIKPESHQATKNWKEHNFCSSIGDAIEYGHCTKCCSSQHLFENTVVLILNSVIKHIELFEYLIHKLCKMI